MPCKYSTILPLFHFVIVGRKLEENTLPSILTNVHPHPNFILLQIHPKMYMKKMWKTLLFPLI
jgi:hypothetical protein